MTKPQTPTASPWRILLETAPCAALILDPRGTVVDVNSAVAKLLPRVRVGVSLLRSPVPDWLADAQRRSVPAAEVLAAGAVGDQAFTARGAPLPGGFRVWWLTEEAGPGEARWLLGVERERAAFLAGASARLLASPTLRMCLRTTVELAAARFADAAAVITGFRHQRASVTWTAAGGSPREHMARIRVEEIPGLHEALSDLPAAPQCWLGPARPPDWLLGEDAGLFGSLCVAPLPGHGGSAGAVVLLRRDDRVPFAEDEESFVRVFAARAGAAISGAALLSERSAVASLLRPGLVPAPLGRSDRVELAGRYRPSPSAPAVGGDFYDWARSGAETTVALGDVCGAGLEAAILASRIRGVLGALRSVETDHLKLLRLLNRSLPHDEDARFATLVLASVTPAANGTVLLRLTSAGHPPPLIVRDDGRVEISSTHGSLLGVMPDLTASTHRTVLRPGEVCLLYSDGVTEARGSGPDAELFGAERLAAILSGCAGMPPEAVVERVEMLTTQWLGGQDHDDIAMVAISIPRRPDAARREPITPERPSG